MYPDKRGGEPALTVVNGAPPPILVSHVHDLDHVTRMETQLLRVHRNVVP